MTIADIESRFATFNESWATLNSDTVTALFTVEPVLLPTVSNQPRTTPAMVRDYFVSFLKLKPVARIESSTIEIDWVSCPPSSVRGTRLTASPPGP